jgi:hypothetical protein
MASGGPIRVDGATRAENRQVPGESMVCLAAFVHQLARDLAACTFPHYPATGNLFTSGQNVTCKAKRNRDLHCRAFGIR